MGGEQIADGLSREEGGDVRRVDNDQQSKVKSKVRVESFQGHFWRATILAHFHWKSLYLDLCNIAVLMGGEVVVCTAASYELA